MEALIRKLTIREDMSIEDTMRTIDENGYKTVFLIIDGILKGTVTDGDVRRYLLNGGDISDNVRVIVNRTPKFFYEWENVDYQSYMIDNMITALPVLNKDRRVLRIELLKEKRSTPFKIEEQVAVIMMAGGLGTRLKPYTEIIPKPLIPIGEKTITEHIFDKFLSYGCDDFYMIVNYKKNLIEAYFNEIEKYKKLSFIEEPFFMGTAGGISLLRDKIEKNFFLINCDTLVDFDYYSIWKRHIENKNMVTIIAAEKEISVPYGTIAMDEHGNVCSLVEKPQYKYYINTGMYLCNSKIYKYVENNEKIDMPDLIQQCLEAGEKIGQVLVNEQDWYDMGQPEELKNMLSRLSAR